MAKPEKPPRAVGGETDTDGSANVYFLTMVDPKDRHLGFVKVGLTKGDVDKRIAQLQTGNPFRLVRTEAFWSPFAALVEHHVHRTHASKGKQLEWLVIDEGAIPQLVETTKAQAERIHGIAQSVARWSVVKSDGKPPRQATAKEKQLRAKVQPIRDELGLAALRLENTTMSIQIAAGETRGIRGLMRTNYVSAVQYFDPNKAAAKFRPLAQEHSNDKIEGSFYWRGPRHGTSANLAEAKRERERKKDLLRKRFELYASILQNWERVPEFGELTKDLTRLHEDFLTLTEIVARLKLDEYEVKAQLIEAIETSEMIEGVCTYKRAATLDTDSFCDSLRKLHGVGQLDECPDLADCRTDCPAHITRPIYRTRSYL